MFLPSRKRALQNVTDMHQAQHDMSGWMLMVCIEWINFHLIFLVIDKFGYLCVVILFKQKHTGWPPAMP